MNPKDLFGVAVRVIGMYLFVPAWARFNTAFYVLVEPLREHKATALTYAVEGTLYLLLSLFLMRCAPLVVEFAYPSQNHDAGDDMSVPTAI